MYKNKKRVLIVFMLLAVIVAGFSYFLAKHNMTSNEVSKKISDKTTIKPSGDEMESNTMEMKWNQTPLNKYRFDYDYKNASLENIMASYLDSKHLDDDIAISYYNFVTNETYHYNENNYMFAASTYKLPLNMYIDELIAKQEINPHTLLTFDESDMEDEYSSYTIGSQIPIYTLQYDSIVYSDNNASHVLFNYLGGWVNTLNAISKYSNMPIPSEYGNYFTSQYMLDTLCYLYENESIFSKLIANMKIAEPEKYLQKYIDKVEIAHKYGNYGTVQNDVGIVYSETPYALAIFTNTVKGEKIIGEINRIIYEYNQARI